MDRVLEMGWYAAGYAGRLFAQAGYDVVRVETDVLQPAYVSQKSMNAYLHANKRRVHVKDPTLIEELANQADIVLFEGRTAQEVEDSGFNSWQSPVKVALTPFGRTGPHRNWRASQNTILAMAGYTNLMGDPDRAPLTLPGHYVDFQTGGYAYTAAAACRYAERREQIDIGMLEVIMSLSQFTTVMWHCSGVVRSRHANDFWSVVPTNLFRCQDGWVYINIVPGFWDPFTTFLDAPELILDDRFKSNTLRMKNRDVLHEIIAEKMLQWTREEIVSRAEYTRIPLGAAFSFPEILNDRHLSERDFWQSVTLSNDEVLRSPRIPYQIKNLTPTELELRAIEEL